MNPAEAEDIADHQQNDTNVASNQSTSNESQVITGSSSGDSARQSLVIDGRTPSGGVSGNANSDQTDLTNHYDYGMNEVHVLIANGEQPGSMEYNWPWVLDIYYDKIIAGDGSYNSAGYFAQGAPHRIVWCYVAVWELASIRDGYTAAEAVHDGAETHFQYPLKFEELIEQALQEREAIELMRMRYRLAGLEEWYTIARQHRLICAKHDHEALMAAGDAFSVDPAELQVNYDMNKASTGSGARDDMGSGSSQNQPTTSNEGFLQHQEHEHHSSADEETFQSASEHEDEDDKEYEDVASHQSSPSDEDDEYDDESAGSDFTPSNSKNAPGTKKNRSPNSGTKAKGSKTPSPTTKATKGDYAKVRKDSGQIQYLLTEVQMKMIRHDYDQNNCMAMPCFDMPQSKHVVNQLKKNPNPDYRRVRITQAEFDRLMILVGTPHLVGKYPGGIANITPEIMRKGNANLEALNAKKRAQLALDRASGSFIPKRGYFRDSAGNRIPPGIF